MPAGLSLGMQFYGRTGDRLEGRFRSSVRQQVLQGSREKTLTRPMKRDYLRGKSILEFVLSREAPETDRKMGPGNFLTQRQKRCKQFCIKFRLESRIFSDIAHKRGAKMKNFFAKVAAAGAICIITA
jgi:hypothetical protein